MSYIYENPVDNGIINTLNEIATWEHVCIEGNSSMQVLKGTPKSGYSIDTLSGVLKEAGADNLGYNKGYVTVRDAVLAIRLEKSGLAISNKTISYGSSKAMHGDTWAQSIVSECESRSSSGVGF